MFTVEESIPLFVEATRFIGLTKKYKNDNCVRLERGVCGACCLVMKMTIVGVCRARCIIMKTTIVSDLNGVCVGRVV